MWSNTFTVLHCFFCICPNFMKKATFVFALDFRCKFCKVFLDCHFTETDFKIQIWLLYSSLPTPFPPWRE